MTWWWLGFGVVIMIWTCIAYKNGYGEGYAKTLNGELDWQATRIQARVEDLLEWNTKYRGDVERLRKVAFRFENIITKMKGFEYGEKVDKNDSKKGKGVCGGASNTGAPTEQCESSSGCSGGDQEAGLRAVCAALDLLLGPAALPDVATMDGVRPGMAGSVRLLIPDVGTLIGGGQGSSGGQKEWYARLHKSQRASQNGSVD